MSDLGFNPLDQEFLSEDAIRQETLQALAGLELDKHRLRLMYVANDENWDTMTQSGSTIGQEVEKVEARMAKIKESFGSVLYPAAATQAEATPAVEQDGN